MNKIFKAVAYLWNRFSIVELAFALFVIGVGFQLFYAVAMAWLFHNFIYFLIVFGITALTAFPLYRMWRVYKDIQRLNDRSN